MLAPLTKGDWTQYYSLRLLLVLPLLLLIHLALCVWQSVSVVNRHSKFVNGVGLQALSRTPWVMPCLQRFVRSTFYFVFWPRCRLFSKDLLVCPSTCHFDFRFGLWPPIRLLTLKFGFNLAFWSSEVKRPNRRSKDESEVTAKSMFDPYFKPNETSTYKFKI